MGYTAIYDEATDHITIKDGDTIIRDEPAMNYGGLATTQEMFSVFYPDREVPTDPKVLRSTLKPKNSKIEAKATTGLIRVDAKVLQKGQVEFLASPDCAFLVEALEKIKGDDKVKITNVMILGSGSMDRPVMDSKVERERDIAIYRQIYFHDATVPQLAATIKISEVLGELGNPLPITAQEIAYSDLEKEFLKTRYNFTSVDDPDAFDLIDKNTLIFLSGAPNNFDHWISEGTWPGAMLTNYPQQAIFARNFTPQICQQIFRMWGFYDGFLLKNKMAIGEDAMPTPAVDEKGTPTFCAWNSGDILWVSRQGQREWMALDTLMGHMQEGEIKP